MAPSFIPEDNIQLSSDVSVKAFTSSLAFNSGIGIAIFVAFCIVRHWSKKIYQPRTYLVNKDLRPPELPPGIFTFVTASFKVKDTELLDKVGLDAYMFLRFLRMSA
ncbi:late exocytosis, associated with Golgi transport-domain-containing protein [Lobosporangium transversale]|uniref:Late exocytosis, associated with Golgi transport-domain-containing protein n=1 Tax=Lobosporangium transversale TaxID=64571 RepID=A0A1Y2GT36_9FUNG|nr:late exocytosis, associated with Golgi transport-domain-containing protein [Lobosporangium transversale]ORZ21952.1 late exocytosis, associated with Golgi transport-domain-containing protein [Lobosporangium transversale]|eukprot:XP_021883203.1 late exocytosis, associated with Golgi transport-domain-containing protein [Lobosporangium transversale]